MMCGQKSLEGSDIWKLGVMNSFLEMKITFAHYKKRNVNQIY